MSATDTSGKKVRMTITTASPADTILGPLGTLLPDLQAVYTDIHAHPELSMPRRPEPPASRPSG